MLGGAVWSVESRAQRRRWKDYETRMTRVVQQQQRCCCCWVQAGHSGCGFVVGCAAAAAVAAAGYGPGIADGSVCNFGADSSLAVGTFSTWATPATAMRGRLQ